jgi:hypothetical protein
MIYSTDYIELFPDVLRGKKTLTIDDFKIHVWGKVNQQPNFNYTGIDWESEKYNSIALLEYKYDKMVEIEYKKWILDVYDFLNQETIDKKLAKDIQDKEIRKKQSMINIKSIFPEIDFDNIDLSEVQITKKDNPIFVKKTVDVIIKKDVVAESLPKEKTRFKKVYFSSDDEKRFIEIYNNNKRSNWIELKRVQSFYRRQLDYAFKNNYLEEGIDQMFLDIELALKWTNIDKYWDKNDGGIHSLLHNENFMAWSDKYIHHTQQALCNKLEVSNQAILDLIPFDLSVKSPQTIEEAFKQKEVLEYYDSLVESNNVDLPEKVILTNEQRDSLKIMAKEIKERQKQKIKNAIARERESKKDKLNMSKIIDKKYEEVLSNTTPIPCFDGEIIDNNANLTQEYIEYCRFYNFNLQ